MLSFSRKRWRENAEKADLQAERLVAFYLKDFGGKNGARAGCVIEAVADVFVKGVSEMLREVEGLPVYDSGSTS